MLPQAHTPVTLIDYVALKIIGQITSIRTKILEAWGFAYPSTTHATSMSDDDALVVYDMIRDNIRKATETYFTEGYSAMNRQDAINLALVLEPMFETIHDNDAIAIDAIIEMLIEKQTDFIKQRDDIEIKKDLHYLQFGHESIKYKTAVKELGKRAATCSSLAVRLSNLKDDPGTDDNVVTEHKIPGKPLVFVDGVRYSGDGGVSPLSGVWETWVTLNNDQLYIYLPKCDVAGGLDDDKLLEVGKVVNIRLVGYDTGDIDEFVGLVKEHQTCKNASLGTTDMVFRAKIIHNGDRNESRSREQCE